MANRSIDLQHTQRKFRSIFVSNGTSLLRIHSPGQDRTNVVLNFTITTHSKVVVIFAMVSLKVSWPTTVKGDPKAPFSITPTPRCRGELPLYLDCPTYP